MTTRVLTLVCGLFTIMTLAQRHFKELKAVTPQDLEASKPVLKSDAAAEILFRSMRYTIDGRGEINEEYVERMKIYDRERAKDYLDRSITYYNGEANYTQNLSKLSGVTYNLENGKVIESRVTKNSKYRSKEDKKYMVEKFAFENVKNGSIVEYSYKLISPSSFLRAIPKFTIDREVPTLYTEYCFLYPRILGYNIDYNGNLKPTYKRSGSETLFGDHYQIYIFGYDNVPAYEEEDFVKNNDNYKTSIRAELNSAIIDGEYRGYAVSWNDIKNILQKDERFGQQMDRRPNYVKGLLPKEILTKYPRKNRADAILKYVQDNYTWNKEIDLYMEGPMRKVIENKGGNSTEMNGLLLSFMHEAELEAYPVVIPTINRGMLTDYSPSITKLNYMFVAMKEGNNYYFYDATSKTAKVYELPRMVHNGKGIMLTNKGTELIDVFYPFKSETHLTIEAKMDADGTFSGSFSDKDTNLYANFVNNVYEEDKAEFEKIYREKYKFSISDIKSGRQSNGDFLTTFNFNSDSFVDTIGNKLVFNPLMFLFMKNHSFNQTTERRAPIDFFTANEKIKKVTITLPEGYKFESIPDSKKFKTDDEMIKYSYIVKPEGDNKLTIETNISIGDHSFSKEYYPAFKQIFDNITKHEGQVATVVKK